MAYGTVFRFRFESCHGTVYEVRLLKNGYSGSITDRPLGRAPVIRMQEGFPFLSTCCELTLECQVDGEYVDLYTTDPNQYKIEVYRKNGSSYQLIWDGFVATELYSEPDIAPPYDVKITATDGLGILKEYDFEASGGLSIRKHIQELLKKTGDTQPYLYTASQLRAGNGTAAGFLDDTEINMDYMVGKNCYEVLAELLKSLRCSITRYGTMWLLVRQVDVQINSSGVLTTIFSDIDPAESSASDTVNCGASVGQMGVADLWPNGYLTRRVVPAKNSVKVRSDWNLRDGAPDLDDWISYDDASSGPGPRYLGSLGGVGRLAAVISMTQFTDDVKVTVKVARGSVWNNYNGTPYIKVLAAYQSGGGGTKYYHPDTGWTTDSPSTGEEKAVDRTNTISDPNGAQTIEVTIPCPNDSNYGNLMITVAGHLVKVYDIDVELLAIKGYEDTIVINNGARGSAEDLSITGGRETSGYLIHGRFVYGVFTSESQHQPLTSFSDGSVSDKDFMSLTALAYAKEHAAPRIEISGKLDIVYNASRPMPPLFIKSHGVWAMMSKFDWDMLNEDVDFTAVTLPTATLTVDSETITSVEAGGSGSGGSGSGGNSGGGGGVTETDPVFKNSPAYGIGSNDIQKWDNAATGLKIYDLEDNGTSAAGTWKAKNDEITALTDGLMVRYKITKAGADTTTLAVNTLAAKTVYRNSSTKLTTQYPVGTYIILCYSSSLNSGSWIVVNDHDANSYAYVRQYIASDNVEYPLLARYETGSVSTYVTKYTKFAAGATVNPSTNKITAGGFKVDGTVGYLKSDGTVDTSGPGGGSSVSWGTEDGNSVPLTVDGSSKTLYKSPSGGIPKTDMAAAVQDSLDLADSALQSVPSDYKKVVECADLAAYQAITNKDSNTLYLIPESSS